MNVLRDKQFSSKELAEIADIRPATLQTWISRYVDSAKPEDGPEGGGSQGRHRTFTGYGVVQYAIAAQLIKSSVSTEMALRAGATFAHSAGPSSGQYARIPGVPFVDPNAKVETMLCVSHKGSTAVPRYAGFDWWKEANVLLGNPGGVFVLPVDRIWIETCWKMALEPNSVLEAAAQELGI
ncbi:hypothetical protein [Roseovarius sp.]|uniref:hypothetical protein n=1 Tax=Roseovarius sp. TaxID=1486281 RepID=UPI003BA940BB